ncbi:hypothetical protein [Persephonella sp.]|uniref:hypothetical protein n=1 Tax=Persephonella sp. TaxID=2060922 RepID=UPI00260F7532|nr:hypothetical protein [Persephonella sp.]
MRKLAIFLLLLTFSCIAQDKLLDSQFFDKIFSQNISQIKAFLEEKGCKDFSERQYGNTYEHYLECRLNNINLMLTYNAKKSQVVELAIIPDKPVKNISDLLNLNGVKEYTIKTVKSKDNPDLISRINILPPDYDNRYTDMIEGN